MANDTKTLAVLTHVLGIITGFIGPLVMLLACQDKEVKKHAKVTLNWQFSYLIYIIISIILVFVIIGIPLLILLGILNIIFGILAAVKASEDKIYKYPLSIKFFKI